MNSRTAWVFGVLLAIAAVVAGVGYFHARIQVGDVRSSELEQLRALLNEDQDTLNALKATDSNILATYLAAIRADGVAKHADTKVRLDRLAENNAGIIALINVY